MQDAVSYCAELVRNADRDRFIATLFAPERNRDALYALYAFNVEVAHVRDRAREAAPGEIRLQWWREVLQGERHGEAMASPVAASLLNAIERHRLPVNAMLALLDARRFDLYDEPMRTIAELEDYALRTESALIAMAAQILGADAVAAARPAGIACVLTQLLAALPGRAARRQLYLPVELLDRHGADAADVFACRSSPALNQAAADLRRLARDHLAAAASNLRALPRQALPAFLPIAPVRRSLDRLDRSDIFLPKALSPWRRQWLIWRAARNPDRLTR
ncbi:MAG: phytoene/squalene synthase family protein [Xanthobacteraceae bacterium]|jgi:phytoene synthase